MVTRAALYVRVSTEKQAERYGIASQVEALVRRAQDNGLVVMPEGRPLIDDGYSGESLDRPAMNRLRELVRQRLVDVVLAYDPDRLSRRLSDLLLLADELEAHGVKLEFITQEVEWSPEGRMFFQMRGVLAEYERAKIRERTMRGAREKARQGKVVSASAPFGYVYDPREKTLRVKEEEAKVVRLIFYRFANERLSLQGLADKLNRLSIPTPRGRGAWRVSTLGHMLRNETYIGRFYQLKGSKAEPERRLKPLGKYKKSSYRLKPKEEWAVAQVPAAVPTELFRAVQTRLEANLRLARRNARHSYLLSGLLRCGLCGSRIGGHVVLGVPYYRCYRKLREKAPLGPDGQPLLCRCPEFQAAVGEAQVWEAVTELLMDPQLLIDQLRRQRENGSEARSFLEEELAQHIRRLEAVPAEERRLVEGYRRGLVPDPLMREEMDRVRRERTDLERRKGELDRRLASLDLTQTQEAQVRELVARASANLGTMDFGQRQELLRTLVEEVVYTPGQLVVKTIIPLDGQLHPLHRGGAGGEGLDNESALLS
ncbi:MAG: recombinase family protein [Chloroflexota bacterium]|nr:recombinase family protein [Chloroflexota bacterium]